MTEQARFGRRDILKGSLIGAVGFAAGGTAEQHNIRGVDRYLEMLHGGFADFTDFVCSRTQLDSFFPGGIRRLAHDPDELRNLFSQKITTPGVKGEATHYQLLIPSDERTFSMLPVAIRATRLITDSGRAGLPTDITSVEAFFAPDMDHESFRLLNSDRFERPEPGVLSASQLRELPSYVMADSRFGSDENWAFWVEDSEYVAGSVFKAELSYTEERRTIGVTVETSGHFIYTEVSHL